MSIIEVKDFSMGFGEKTIFSNTNFVLNPGEKIGLVGLNGAGKSTLIKIIIGEKLIDGGSIYINKKYAIKYLDQYAEIDKHCSIREYLRNAYKDLYDIEEKYNNIVNCLATETNSAKIDKLLLVSGELYDKLLDSNFYAIDSEIEKISYGLGVTALGLETNIETLSGGQRAKVLLAKLLLENPDVMILDEPTNFLDTNHIDWLTKYIKSSEKAFIIVSHDEHFLNDVVTHVYDLDNKVLNKYTGNLIKMQSIKDEKRRLLEKGFESQQKEIKKLEDYIAKNKARASTAKMAHSREKMLDKIQLIDPPSERLEPTFKFNEKMYAGNLMLKVNDLVIGYDRPLLKNKISFEVCKGDRIAIVGFNGIGKSTLLKTLLGMVDSLGGGFTWSNNIMTGYYEQENDFNRVEGTPLNYIINMFPKLSEKEARTKLFNCGLNSEHVKKQIKYLSGGEQSKIKLCVLSIKQNNFLILDEPTNHLDKLAIGHLEKILKEYNGGVLFVSHSKDFVNRVATKVINLENY